MLGAGFVVVALVVTHSLANANRKNSRNLLNVIIIIFMLNRNGTFFRTNKYLCMFSVALERISRFCEGGSLYQFGDDPTSEFMVDGAYNLECFSWASAEHTGQ